MATSDLPTDPDEYDRWFRDRKPDPYAEGLQFEAWIEEFGISENQLHYRTGRPRDYINKRRKYVQGNPELKTALDGKQVTWSHVREILAGAPDDHEVQRVTLDMVVKRRKAKRRVDGDAIRMFARGAASARTSPQT